MDYFTFKCRRITFIPVLSGKVVPSRYLYISDLGEQMAFQKKNAIILTIPHNLSLRKVAKFIKKHLPDEKEVYIWAGCSCVPLKFKTLPCIWCTEVDDCQNFNCPNFNEI